MRLTEGCMMRVVRRRWRRKDMVLLLIVMTRIRTRRLWRRRRRERMAHRHAIRVVLVLRVRVGRVLCLWERCRDLGINMVRVGRRPLLLGLGLGLLVVLRRSVGVPGVPGVGIHGC